MTAVLLILIGYLSGSAPTGVILAAWFRPEVDLRRVGSGNIGATNVGRAMGAQWGVVTMLGDAMKGLLPVLLARWWSGSAVVVTLTGLAAFMGHIYPVYLGFKGGKGVATALGVLLGLSPPTALLALIIWAGVSVITRNIGAGSLSAALALPIIAAGVPHQSQTWFFALVLVVSAMIFYTHRDNIRAIVGNESR